jgi:WhiB family transcriptional regulator, redox-sensing transcriptional regulator
MSERSGSAAALPGALTRPLAERERWWAHARCREVAADLAAAFFSQRPRDIAGAKRVCATCPVITPCLEGALRRREPCGVWGGQLFHHGRILTVKRARGRPPTRPRPEDQLPEIPIPAPLRHLAVVHGA